MLMLVALQIANYNYNLEGNLYQTADETVLVFKDIHSKCFKTIYIVMRF